MISNLLTKTQSKWHKLNYNLRKAELELVIKISLSCMLKRTVL